MYVFILMPFVLVPLAVVIFSFFIITRESRKLPDKMLLRELSFDPPIQDRDL